MSGFSSVFPSFCELVATWLGGGGQAYTMDYQGRSHTRFDSGHRHLFLPYPTPLNSIALLDSDESTWPSLDFNHHHNDYVFGRRA